MLYAIKPAVIAIIVQALLNLARTAVKTTSLGVIGLLSAVLSFGGFSPLLVLTSAGLSSVSILLAPGRSQSLLVLPTLPTIALQALRDTQLSGPALRLFLSFLKIGFVVFGSGYVLLAFLRTEFIDHLHWLTDKQLIDAVAVGQFTPGPVFTTATFIRYLVAGVPGAVTATIGIFLPGFLLVALSGPLLTKIRCLAWAGALLDGVMVGSLALMAVVAIQLGRAAVVDWVTLAILITSAIAIATCV
jgi:chromate transporter